MITLLFFGCGNKSPAIQTYPALFKTNPARIASESVDIIQEDIFESIKELEKTGQKINSLKLNKDNPALNLANWIDRKSVV